MVELISHKNLNFLPSSADLLEADEKIVIVDDSPEIVLLLETYLTRQNIAAVKARNADELYTLFDTYNIALILLDIGLPGKSGTEILAEIAPNYPDLGIIMVTGTTDIQIALDCLRQGADDYLTKPVIPREFNHTLYQTLRKRKLAIENRRFQRELETSNFRLHFLHHLNLKMNTAYLNALELDGVLHTILAGITSDEGLQFNRAFLALFNDEGTLLSGKTAIGPSSKEEAGTLWKELQEQELALHDILSDIAQKITPQDSGVNRIVQSLQIPITDSDHILIQAGLQRESIRVSNGKADKYLVPESLLNLLGEDNFIIVPLFSPSRTLGVIIADNFVTGSAITKDDAMALEIFATQASLAIEHSHLYQDMTVKINELELVTKELEKSKDMLVEAERYSTLGYVSAQLVHAIRNPLTSIGGTARLLLKKEEDKKTRRYLKIISQETDKVEDTLKNLFTFAGDIALEKSTTQINTLLKQCLASFYPTLQKNRIHLTHDLDSHDYMLDIDQGKIRQVFLHLIRNSIEAMESGGELHISTYQNIDSLVVSIIDSGSGISSSVLDQVGDPFYTTKTYGTGLGLSLVEQILNLHNAVFSLEQLSPHGTKATVKFRLN